MNVLEALALSPRLVQEGRPFPEVAAAMGVLEEEIAPEVDRAIAAGAVEVIVHKGELSLRLRDAFVKRCVSRASAEALR